MWGSMEFCDHEGLVSGLFEQCVDRAPDAWALICDGERWSYADLDALVNRLSYALIEAGVDCGTAVGLCLERSPVAIAAMLAIFRVGGVYVPMDPAAPVERLRYMFGDSGVRVLIADTPTWERCELSECDDGIVLLDPSRVDWAGYPAQHPAIPVPVRNLAYLIYTSGSTGKPKAVAVEHRSIALHVQRMRRLYDFDSADRLLQLAALSFDLSLEQILIPLCSGAALVLAPPGFIAPDELSQMLVEHRVTVLNLTPPMLEMWLEQGDSVWKTGVLRLLVVGADVFRMQLLDLWRVKAGSAASGIRLLNGYGPTEATVTASLYEVPAQVSGDRMPIGMALPYTQLHVLDGQMRPCAPGVEGELWIGGRTLARGYFNRPELTRRVFVADPFSDRAGARLYRSGDRARVRVDGNIEFLGRVDDQVKIRGFRVELGEIEVALHAHPAVRRAAVLCCEVDGELQLWGFLVGQWRDFAELRRFLARSLPDYMLPEHLYWLDELPLNASGKVDRHALRALGLRAQQKSMGS